MSQPWLGHLDPKAHFVLQYLPAQPQSYGPEPTGLHVQVLPSQCKEMEEKGRQPLQSSRDAVCADGFDTVC